MDFLKNKYILIFIFGFLIRLSLIYLPGFHIDVNDWFAWSLRLSSFDFAHFYSKEVFTDYTPGYLYVLSLLGFLKNLTGLPDNLFYLILKLPAIIADLLIGLFIYQEIKKHLFSKLTLAGFLLILFNPAAIFNSSVWGQIDSILALLLLLTVLFLQKNNLIFSSIFFALALLVKPQAISLAPLLAVFLLKHFNLKNVLRLTIPGLLILYSLTFPFFPNLINFFQHITNTANEYPYTSLNAYNFWGVIGFWIFDNKVWHSFSYQAWGYVLLAGYWILLGYLFFKEKLSIYAAATLATLGFFFLPTRVHERYLYPALVFLVLTAFSYKSKLLLILTGFISALHLLNLYYVYVYYNEIYYNLPKLLYHAALYNFLSANSINLSFISTILFVLITIGIIKYNVKTSAN